MRTLLLILCLLSSEVALLTTSSGCGGCYQDGTLELTIIPEQNCLEGYYDKCDGEAGLQNTCNEKLVLDGVNERFPGTFILTGEGQTTGVLGGQPIEIEWKVTVD